PYTTFTFSLFFFTHTAPTYIYPLSLHDALPIYQSQRGDDDRPLRDMICSSSDIQRLVVPFFFSFVSPLRQLKLDGPLKVRRCWEDRKSTRLNSSHLVISYAVFCLKKKKKK